MTAVTGSGLPATMGTPGGNARLTAVLLLLIIVAGLGVRLYQLDAQSVWYDEASSIIASQGTFEQLQTRMIEASSHPPGHYFLLFGAFKLLGFGTWEARFVSVLFGTMAIGAVFLLASTLFDRRTGLVAAALLSLSQLALLYAQEARPYAALLFLSVSTQLAFVHTARRPTLWRWGLSTLVATSMIYTHYYGVFVVAAIFFAWLVMRDRTVIPVRWWIGAVVASLVLLTPWILWGLRAQMAHWVPIAVRGDLPPWFRVSLATPIQILNAFNNGKFAGVLNSAPLWSFVAGSVIYTVPALGGMWAAGRSQGAIPISGRDAVIFALMNVLVPIAAVLLLAFRDVVYDVRYVSFCIAPYFMLVALGLTRVPRVSIRSVWTVVALAYGTVALWTNYTIPYKENYRDALAHVAGELRPGDVCIFEPYGIPLQWQVYHGEHAALPTTTLDDVEKGEWTNGRVWLVGFTRTPHGARRAREVTRRLQSNYTLLATRRYFWVEVAVFDKKREGASPDSLTDAPISGNPASDRLRR